MSALLQGAAVADFDADHRADSVVPALHRRDAKGGVYAVSVRLTSTSEERSFEVAASSQPWLYPRDVDNDKDLDLVIITADGARVGVWLNDGRGGFSKSEAVIYPESIWRDPPSAVRSPDKSVQQYACSADGCLFAAPRFFHAAIELQLFPAAASCRIALPDLSVHRIRPPPSALFPL